MRFFNSNNSGYTKGSLDVITAINLFLKFLLISPILLFAGYVSIAMMKHVIFHGIPSMNKPTPEQIERLREADSQIGSPVSQREVESVSSPTAEVEVQEPKGFEGNLVKSTSPDISSYLRREEEKEYHRQATEAYQRDLKMYQMAYRNWVSCVSAGGRCEFSGEKPSFANYYQL